mgnify:CR=1 FL=1
MSDLQRLLGIPPALWELELKGMSEDQLDALHISAVEGMNPYRALLSAIDDEEARRKEPPTLRPGATVRATKDLRSMNGHPIKKGDEIRVTGFGEGLVTGQWGGLVVTVKESDVEVNR